MPNFTKMAIKDSFLKLLNEQPLNKISVRSIVEDCGINRNTFYYHFQDIPTLIEEIIEEQAENVIKKYPSIESLDECFSVIFETALKNKKAIYHIFNSVNRDMYERSLMRICEYVITSYVKTAFPDGQTSPEVHDIIIRFFKCQLFGLIYDWIISGMRDDSIEMIHKITAVCRGLSDEIINRFNEGGRTE